MVNGLKFPSRLLASNHQGHWNKGRAALWMAVQRRRRKPRTEYEVRGQPQAKSSGVDTREKPDGETTKRPYRKPTQVGEASSLR